MISASPIQKLLLIIALVIILPSVLTVLLSIFGGTSDIDNRPEKFRRKFPK